jgi:peroxiredoxin
MPALAEAHREFGDRVTFVGVNMSDPAVVAQNFADRYGVTFPILLDNGSALTLGLGISIAPTTLFINSEGVIVEQVSGELTAEDLTVRLNTLVSS